MGSSSHLPGRVVWIAAAAATALSLAVPSAASGSSGATGVAIPRSSGGLRPSQPVGMQVAAGPFSGHLGITGDGLGTLSDTGTLTVKIHDPDSTILSALLYVKTNNYATASQIGFEGETVPLTFVPGDSPSCCPGFYPTYRADVTSIVAATVGSGSGTFLMDVDESVTGLGSDLVDGEALYVVYDDASLPSREIYLMEGGVTSLTPEPVDVSLLSPYAGGRAKMSIGISFSTEECPPVGSQYTIVTVQGNVVSDCAGGFEDGAFANGALLTVGGYGDDFANPAQSGADDEKYDIAPSLTVGDTTIDLTFENPSGDDSTFVLAIAVTMPVTRDGARANAGVFG